MCLCRLTVDTQHGQGARKGVECRPFADGPENETGQSAGPYVWNADHNGGVLLTDLGHIQYLVA